MIEKVISRKNMLQAYHQVVSNQGLAGVDSTQINALWDHLIKNRNTIITAACYGRYLPQPILGVAIPKSNGKTRLLGIPTVTDRLLQQAVSQVMAPLFELEYSYGFRPNRNSHQAVQQAQNYRTANMYKDSVNECFHKLL